MLKSLIDNEKYTTEELNARLKFFIGIILGLTLFGIVFVVLYSLIFVTQPMNGMSPVDNKFFELIIPIATFLTGTLSGIMLAGDDKDLRAKALEAANKPPPPSPPSSSSPSTSGFNATGLFGGTNFSMSTPGFGNSVPAFGAGQPMGQPAQPMMSSSGKPMPFQDPHPEI